MTPSVCFVCLNGYNVLARGADVSHIGGAEVQQLYIARGLIEHGYRVSFVTKDHGQPDGELLDGIRVFKAYRPDAGLPGLRSVHPRWTRLWAAMRRADADVYYQRTGGLETGQVCLWCRLHRRSFVFSVSHDSQCKPELPKLTSLRHRMIYRFGLRNADAVVAQTHAQQTMLSRWMPRDTELIRSCIPLPSGDRVTEHPPLDPPRVLWVGRLSPEKRPDVLLDVARLCPNVQFDMVGSANRESDFARSILEQAARIPNINRPGYVPHHEMAGYYRNATALLCTSAAEGFPNTFLEAWAHGRPVISTLDPDDVVSRSGSGLVASEARDLSRQIMHLLNDRSAWRRCAEAARRHVETEHSVTRAVGDYERLIAAVSPGHPDERHGPVRAHADTAQPMLEDRSQP